MKIQELHKKTQLELNIDLLNILRKQLYLRLQINNKNLNKKFLLKKIRINICKIKTLLSKKNKGL